MNDTKPTQRFNAGTAPVGDIPVREPAFTGWCGNDPAVFRNYMREFFTAASGPGLPHAFSPDGTLRAALVPHVDFPRGGISYAWGYKEIVECTDASLFVIVGTAHHSYNRFTLTRRSFRTPLGVVETDQAYIDRLERHYGGGLFDDELQAHLLEHSIELPVLFLHYLYEKQKPIRIVPLLVGSFADCVDRKLAPLACADIGALVRALRAVEDETDESICYLISGDLAHIGPKFGDPAHVDATILAESRNQDQKFLRAAQSACAESVFQSVAAENDVRRICGMPPIYLALAAARPSRGKVLHYCQVADPSGSESVSFASMAFYR